MQIPEKLFAFGNASGPRAPRALQDFGLTDEKGTVGPEAPLTPQGASTFSDARQAPLSGRYYSIEKGLELPEGLAVTRDDQQADPQSRHRPSHYTIYPSRAMPYSEFTAKFLSLGWKYEGKKLQ